MTNHCFVHSIFQRKWSYNSPTRNTHQEGNGLEYQRIILRSPMVGSLSFPKSIWVGISPSEAVSRTIDVNKDAHAQNQSTISQTPRGLLQV